MTTLEHTDVEETTDEHTTVWHRLYHGETAIDFYGRRWRFIAVSLACVVITGVSLLVQDLNLGLEFTGGSSWDVPAENLTVDEARAVLDDAGFDGGSARIQELSGEAGDDRLKIQIGDLPNTAWNVPASDLTVDEARTVLDGAGLAGDDADIEEQTVEGGTELRIAVDVPVTAAERRAVSRDLAESAGVRANQLTVETEEALDSVQGALAEAAGVEQDSVSVQSVSGSWGERVTRQALKALVVFIALVVVFIAIRFELLMSAAAIVAMLHDVLISVGIYSVFGLVVTPATVIAFLTILGFSLYDTIVVFDKVRENRARYAGSHLGLADVTNISMNQVLMRSLNTSIAAVLPVVSLLIVGTWILGVETLREFSLALFIGMAIGVYSSIFIATPLLAMIREPHRTEHATGEELRRLVKGGSPGGKRRKARLRQAEVVDEPAIADEIEVDDTVAAAPRRTRRPSVEATPETLLQHAPRPRKKKRH